MPKVKIIQRDQTIKEMDAPHGWSVMEVALENKIDGIDGICGGCISCATCHVYVHPDWVSKLDETDNEKSDEEEDLLDTAFDIRDTSRLSCQISMSDELDGLVVALPGTKTDW